MAIGRLFGGNARDSEEKVDYVRTLPHDGRKEVNFEKFLARPKVKRQIDRLRQQVITPQRKRSQGEQRERSQGE